MRTKKEDDGMWAVCSCVRGTCPWDATRSCDPELSRVSYKRRQAIVVVGIQAVRVVQVQAAEYAVAFRDLSRTDAGHVSVTSVT